MNICLSAFLLAAVLACPVAAADVESAFNAGNKLYDQARYSEAAAAYQEIIKAGQAPAAVYYNLGNALVKEGQLGRGIAVYRMLEAATPRDPDLRANIQFAMNRVQGPTWKASWLSTWIRRLTLNEWALAAMACLWAVLLLLSACRIRPQRRSTLRPYVILAAVCTGATAVCVGLALHCTISVRRAIVIAPEANVRQAPLEEASTVFKASDGAELLVLDRNGDWLQVSADPRRVGWISRDQVLSTN